MALLCLPEQVQAERDELYQKFTRAINEVQQKTGFKNLLLERKLHGLLSLLEQKEVELSEVVAASNLSPSALSLVSHKLEVLRPGKGWIWGAEPAVGCLLPPNALVPILHGCRWHITRSRHSQGHVWCRRALGSASRVERVGVGIWH